MELLTAETTAAWLADFTGRVRELENIPRWHSYRPMFYRTNLATHSRHVLALIQNLLPHARQYLNANFDAVKTQLLGLIHDDPELITGDVEMGNKLKMSPAELAALKTHERDAIAALAERFPQQLGNYSYRALLTEAAELKTPEARLTKLADKFDAFGEALHEIFAGNQRFATNLVNEYGVITLPTDYYSSYLVNFPATFPEFAAFFQSNHPLVTPPLSLDYYAIAKRGVPHTADSINLSTECPHYNLWRGVMRQMTAAEDQEHLYQQTETAARFA